MKVLSIVAVIAIEIINSFSPSMATAQQPKRFAEVLARAAGGGEVAQLSIPLAQTNGRDFAIQGYENFRQGRFTEAFSLDLRAANLGNTTAQFNLALAYSFGWGTAQSFDSAFPLYWAAAQAGMPQAMHNLGVYFDEGKGVQQDKKAAAMWYRKAAELGAARSKTNLGLMLVKGEGIERNESEGFGFLLAAAEHGIPSAQQSVASLYAQGIGIRLDVVQAYKWFRILERSKPAARRWIQKVTTSMQKWQIDAAERAAQEWRATPTAFDEDAVIKP